MDLDALQKTADRENAARKPVCLRVCAGAGCESVGSPAVRAALAEAAAKAGRSDVEVIGVGCLGGCGAGPVVRRDTPAEADVLFEHVTPAAADALIAGEASGPGGMTRVAADDPFYAGQIKIVLEHCGFVDPDRLESSLAAGAYRTLHHVLHEMTPAQVVDAMIRSGLRGRGGAGFPTGVKWATVAKQPAGKKFVVCNGDEGDPGAFMDRSVMEGDPHKVLEGMAIAAYAVGADAGYVYVRAEYPLAVKRLNAAIRQATRAGLLGAKVLDTAVSFDVEVRIGAGAFVCGEETALITSIEGGRGAPRPRPPYPAESGLWGRPTLINNVETFANVPAILRRGPEWFAGIGTAGSKGTKVFALAGKVRRAGLVEVPMGTSLRTIVSDMGGGTPDGSPIKAVQTGGPSGGCVPASLLDTPVDYEALAALGSIMGSGGMIVMDDRTDMVDVARYFMDFCRSESCGKCVPCRAGTVQLHALLGRFVEARATAADLETLEDLCRMVADTSLCGLGQSAPNPVLSTLRHFRGEYLTRMTPRSAAQAV